MIINNMHLLRNDEDGRDLLELLQQRAGSLSLQDLIESMTDMYPRTMGCQQSGHYNFQQ